MRIGCCSVADFLENLQAHQVYTNTIYLDRRRNPLNGTPRDATSFEVVLQVCAILEFADGGQALLQGAEVCGIDRHSRDASDDGSQRMAVLIEQINSACTKSGLTVRPGMLDM